MAQKLQKTAVRKLQIICENGAAHGPALAVYMFGGGINHYIRAELKGALQERRGKHVVHNHSCTRLVRHLGHCRNIYEIQLWVGGCFQKHRLRRCR